MTAPLIPLMLLSAGFGYLYGESFLHFLAPWTRPDLLGGHAELSHDETYERLEHLSILVALGGMALAGLLYGAAPRFVAATARSLPLIHAALLNKWWVDELYNILIVRPLRLIATICFSVIDRIIIDGSVNGVGSVVEVGQDVLRRVHTGRVTSYAAFMFFGCIAITAFYLLL